MNGRSYQPSRSREFKFGRINTGQLQDFGDHTGYAAAFEALRSDFHPVVSSRRAEFNTAYAHHSIKAYKARQSLNLPEEKPVRYRGRPVNKQITQMGMNLN